MISHKIAVHQLIDVCTTRVVHVHISCWASAHQLLCDRRTYIFWRHLLNIPTTSIISFEDFYLGGQLKSLKHSIHALVCGNSYLCTRTSVPTYMRRNDRNDEEKWPELTGKFAQRLGYKWAKPWSTFLIALRIGLQSFGVAISGNTWQ